MANLLAPLSWLRAHVLSPVIEKKIPGLSLVANFLANQLWLIENTWRSLVAEAYGANAVVYACLRLLCQAIAEAPLKPYHEDDEGERTELPRDHDLAHLLRHPNELMTQFEMVELITIHTAVVGRSVWWKERSNSGQVIALWPLRPDRVGPVYSPPDAPMGQRVLLGWAYQEPSGGRPIGIPRRDCISFNFPNPMGETGGIVEGFGPVAAISREVAADNKATAHVGALLANYAQPGIALKIMEAVDETTANLIKAKFRHEFGGVRTGTPAILDAATEIQVLGFNLRELEFPDLRANAEARICAAMGVPAVLVGVKTGLDKATYSNVKESREFFAETTCSMYWRRYADQFTLDLAQDFDDQIVIEFDTTKVRALAGQILERIAPIKEAWEKGGAIRNEYRQALGLDPLPPEFGEVILLPAGSTEVPVTEAARAAIAKRQAAAPPPEPAAQPAQVILLPPEVTETATEAARAKPEDAKREPAETEPPAAQEPDKDVAGKLNPYHGADGRFASGSGGGGGGGAHGGAARDPKVLAKGLIEQAKAEEPAVTAAMQGAASKAGGEMRGLDFRVKSEESLARKIAAEHRLNREQTMDETAGSVTDVLRYTMVLPPDRYATGVDIALQHLRAEGMEPHDHKFRNYWGGGEYQGLNTVMKTKTGQRFELQFHTPASLATKESNHPLYEQARVSRSKRLRQELSDKMTSAWRTVTVPAGVQQISGAAYGWGA